VGLDPPTGRAGPPGGVHRLNRDGVLRRTGGLAPQHAALAEPPPLAGRTLRPGGDGAHLPLGSHPPDARSRRRRWGPLALGDPRGGAAGLLRRRGPLRLDGRCGRGAASGGGLGAPSGRGGRGGPGPPSPPPPGKRRAGSGRCPGAALCAAGRPRW